MKHTIASTNEHLTLKITNLRQRLNLKQPETKKITTTFACAIANAESSNSAKSICMKEDLKEKDSVINNKSNRKPQVFIVGDIMIRDLKGWLMARYKAVKVYTFPDATCEGYGKLSCSTQEQETGSNTTTRLVGTNDMHAGTPADIADKICHLATRITSNNIRCAVSTTMIRRGDYLATSGDEVN